MQPQIERRSEQRRAISRDAKLLHGDGQNPIKCTIRNAGKKGCLIASDELVYLKGKQVGLLVSGVESLVRGIVIWCKGNSAGIEFDDASLGLLLAPAPLAAADSNSQSNTNHRTVGGGHAARVAVPMGPPR